MSPDTIQFRELRFADLPNTETRTFTIPVSSELPVTRWWGTEILDHSPDAIDMARLQDGAPLLLDHDPTKQIGVVESATLDDRKLMATVRFSRSALGEEVMQDVIDGIRKNVSIGYQIHDLAHEAKDTYRATRWAPMEITVTSVPADPSVGFGRSADAYNPLELLNHKRGTAMSDTEEKIPADEPSETPVETRAEPATDVAALVYQAIQEERQRSASIREHVRMAKLDESIAEKLIDSGKPLDECRSEVLRLWSEKVDATATASGRPEGESHQQSRAAELAHGLLKQVSGAK